MNSLESQIINKQEIRLVDRIVAKLEHENRIEYLVHYKGDDEGEHEWINKDLLKEQKNLIVEYENQIYKNKTKNIENNTGIEPKPIEMDGFSKNHHVHKIIGITLVNNVVHFFVKFYQEEEIQLIPEIRCKKYALDKLIEYYKRHFYFSF